MQYSDSEPQVQNLLKSQASLQREELPPIVPPAGLSAARQWYLYREIRPFVDILHQDIVAPLPKLLETRAAEPDSENESQPPKRKRKGQESEPAGPSKTKGKGKGRGKNRQDL